MRHLDEVRVFIPMPRFEAGGLERVQGLVGRGLAQAGFRVEILAGRANENARGMAGADIVFRELAQNRIGFVVRLFGELRRRKPEVILTSSNDVGCFVLLLKPFFWRSSRVVWTQHLSISGPLGTSAGLRRLWSALIIRLMRRLVPRADAIVGVSNAVSQDLQMIVGQELQVDVIPNPVVDSDFSRRSREPITWPWTDRFVPTIVFVGRVAPVKRIDLLLAAFAECRVAAPIRLLIVGDGPDLNRAVAQAEELALGEDCVFLGHRHNPLPWVRQSDLLVLCSDSEGFGLVLVEAMACGTQVASTDCPDGPAEILGNGRYGRLVPVDDVQALAGAILESLRSPVASAEQLQLRANEFTVDRAVGRYLDLIQRVTRC